MGEVWGFPRPGAEERSVQACTCVSVAQECLSFRGKGAPGRAGATPYNPEAMDPQQALAQLGIIRAGGISRKEIVIAYRAAALASHPEKKQAA